jgi:hypothetical protein
MPLVLLAVATAVAALVGDAAVESILDGGDHIVALGGAAEFDVGTTTTLAILISLSAAAALAWAAAIAFARGRRLERRMAEELDARWDAQSRHNAGVEGRNKLLEYRTAELQTKLDEMSTKRDALVEEVRAVRKRTSELQNIAHEQRETILRLTGGEPSKEDLIVVPEAPEDSEAVEEALAADGGSLDEAQTPGSGSS